jgi:hypothetical protein
MENYLGSGKKVGQVSTCRNFPTYANSKHNNQSAAALYNTGSLASKKRGINALSSSLIGSMIKNEQINLYK